MASRSDERPLFTISKRRDALMDEYHIVFKDGETQYILAENLEAAAWAAYDLARTENKQLKDIIPTYVKQQILSEQMETGQEPA